MTKKPSVLDKLNSIKLPKVPYNLGGGHCGKCNSHLCSCPERNSEGFWDWTYPSKYNKQWGKQYGGGKQG